MHMKNEEQPKKKSKSENIKCETIYLWFEDIVKVTSPCAANSTAYRNVIGCFAPTETVFFFCFTLPSSIGMHIASKLSIYWICVRPMKTDKVYYQRQSRALAHIIHSASESFSVVSKINTITTQNAHAHLWSHRNIERHRKKNEWKRNETKWRDVGRCSRFACCSLVSIISLFYIWLSTPTFFFFSSICLVFSLLPHHMERIRGHKTHHEKNYLHNHRPIIVL